MDFDTILAILFLLLFVVPQVIRLLFSKKTGPSPINKSQASQKAEKGRKPGLKKFFSDIAAQSKKEFELAINELKPRPEHAPAGWQKVMPPPQEPEHKPAPELPSDYQSKLAKVIKKEGLIKEKQKKEEEPAIPLKKAIPPPKSRGYTVQELRKAIVWSEILAPPLALRDENEKGGLG